MISGCSFLADMMPWEIDLELQQPQDAIKAIKHWSIKSFRDLWPWISWHGRSPISQDGWTRSVESRPHQQILTRPPWISWSATVWNFDVNMYPSLYLRSLTSCTNMGRIIPSHPPKQHMRRISACFFKMDSSGIVLVYPFLVLNPVTGFGSYYMKRDYLPICLRGAWLSHILSSFLSFHLSKDTFFGVSHERYLKIIFDPSSSILEPRTK